MVRRRAIGLDIGTNAVRAAEVSFGRGGPVLRRFGQVALPYGTVVAGEVVDVPAVSAALRRLWKEVGYSSRKVVVGVANSRVVARVSELPDMPDADIRSSLQYQVQDLIPIPLEEAVRKLTGLPATNLELDRRGFLREGMFADVTVFDPLAITDRATFEKPHQFATGMRHVFVNGGHVLENGEHTGAKPGRVVHGPGKK